MSLILNIVLLSLLLVYPVAALVRSQWQTAERLAAAAFALALFNVVAQLVSTALPGQLFSHHPASMVVALVVSFIGWMVTRFACHYLQGDPRHGHFLRHMQWLLSGVIMVVLTNHAVVFLLGWIGISLALHQLLLFYPERPRAQLAAHKKFLFARTAELLLAAAFVLLATAHQSVWLSDLLQPTSGPQGEIAMLLIVVAALIKCAQLPFHGWLIQVVETPTPVSALLHAGVINLGGYLLMLASPLRTEASTALLLTVAGVTVVVATLAMQLQTSVKERLAWSTSAQMGLMLLECALGLYALALLHLAAHSCYKAFGFLSAGSSVNSWLAEQMVPASVNRWTSLLRHSLITALLLVPLYLLGVSPAVLALLALTLLLAPALAALALAALYLAQEQLFAGLLPAVAAPGATAIGWMVLLSVLLLVSYLRLGQPGWARWRHWLRSGLFLDHWATHITLKIWPHPVHYRNPALNRNSETLS